MNHSRLHEKGFGLVEIVVAAAVLSVVMMDIFSFFQSTLSANRATESEHQASYLLEEGVEALKIFRDTSYTNNFLNMSTTTTHFFSWSSASSTWGVSTADVLIDGKYERKFTLSDVVRDSGTHNISTTGIYDPNTKLITETVSWLSGNASAGYLTPLNPDSLFLGNAYPNSSGLVLSPDSKFLYMLKINGSAIYMFSRDTSTGLLTPLSPSYISTAGNEPFGIAISPDGRSIYIANHDVDVITRYSRDLITGLLTNLGTYTTGVGSTHPISIAVSPDGNFVYVLNDYARNIYKFNRSPVDGSLSGGVQAAFVGGAYCPSVIAISPDGKGVYSSDTCGVVPFYGFKRDLITGALTNVGTIPSPAGVLEYAMGIAISPDGSFVYVPNYNSSTITMYSRDLNTSVLTLLNPSTIVNGSPNPYDIAISPDGFFAYVSDYGSNMISQYKRNVTTGVLSPLNPVNIWAGVVPGHVAVSPDGGSVYDADYWASNIYMYQRDPGMTTRTIQTYITNLFNN